VHVPKGEMGHDSLREWNLMHATCVYVRTIAFFLSAELLVVKPPADKAMAMHEGRLVAVSSKIISHVSILLVIK
jgi:hypothetical protein